MRAEAIPFIFQGKPVWLLHKDRSDVEVYTAEDKTTVSAFIHVTKNLLGR
jgi:hypothetical protein